MMHSTRPNPARAQRTRAPRMLSLVLLPALMLGACSDHPTAGSTGHVQPGTTSNEVTTTPRTDAAPGVDTTHAQSAADGDALLVEGTSERVESGTLSKPIVVQVVDGEGGAPVAGASAVVLDRGRYDLGAYFAARRAGRPESELRREFGQPEVTDERGELALDWSGKTTHIWIETDDGRVAHGNAKDAVDGHLVLPLPDDRGIVVVVRDSADMPVAGVPIVATDSSGRSLGGLAPIGHTNASGLARLDPALLLLGTTDGGAQPVFVGLGVVAREPIGARVALTEASPAPIELVLPPFGAVNVVVAHPDETPQEAQPHTLHLRARVDGEQRSDRSAWLDQRIVVTAASTDGSFRFPHVLLGQQVLVQADLHRGGVELPPLLEANGPVRAGEDVALTVELAPKRKFVGRLTTSSAGPLETRGWTALVHSGDQRAPSEVNVLVDGSFEFEVDTRHLARGLTEATFERREDTASDLVTEHTLPIPLPVTAGTDPTELGTVGVERLAIIVAGRVLNERGAPISGAEIEAQQRYACSARSASGDDGADWKHVGTTRSGADGCFVIRRATSGVDVGVTETPAEELVLTVSAQRRATRKCDAALGQSDVVVTLVQAGSVRGQLVHRTARFPLHVGIGLEDEHGALVQFQGDASRRIDLGPLEPGRYVLKVYGPADSEPCLELAGLVVESGAECIDPRLDPIDLTDALAIGQLEVVDEAGTALEDEQIWIVRRSEGSNESALFEPARHSGSDWLVFRRTDPPIVEVTAARHATSEQLAREGLNRHVLVELR